MANPAIMKELKAMFDPPVQKNRAVVEEPSVEYLVGVGSGHLHQSSRDCHAQGEL
jgi:hypothetical protein